MTHEREWRERIGLVLGPVLFLVMLLAAPPEGMSVTAWRAAAVGALMATWWITEAIPISATALLPIVAFPLLGVLTVEAATAPYANQVIFLFLGGFLLAMALERVGLHMRIALNVLRISGSSPAQLVGGFMAATALLSMWVSNTATVAMMLPLGTSVLLLAQGNRSDADASNEAATRNLGTALMLGIAYAASIGGLGTLIGTPPNALLAGYMAEAHGIQIGFVQWMAYGVPLVLVALPVAWYLLVYVQYPSRGQTIVGGKDMIRNELHKLGPAARGEWLVGIVVTSAAVLWITSPILNRVITGISDAGIAIAAALALFLLPGDRGRRAILEWEDAERLPWGVLLLFGGGLSLARAIDQSGLASWIGTALEPIGVLHVVVVVLCVTAVIVFLTEITSNTATAAAFLPVVGALAIAIGQDPVILAVSAAVGASCAFMLPVATPPNAIVYGSGQVNIMQMVRAGFWLNLFMIVLITIFAFGPIEWIR